MNSQNQIEPDTSNKIREHLSLLLPAVDIITKNYSLEPDMALGWKPKIKIVGPVPLNFDNAVIDTTIQVLTSFGKKHKYRVIYLGLRPASSYKVHQDLRHEYQYKYDYLFNVNYNNLGAFFRKFYSNFQSTNTTRLFKGMNPTVKIEDQIIFDSTFQGGNLDTVIKVSDNQYDLFMRIDSNTKGHTQWFNFTMKSMKKKRIKINICNFRKDKTLLARGMKPYILSKYLNQKFGIGWRQGGDNVKFTRQYLRYDFLEEQGFTQEQITFYFLKFQYQFEVEGDQVTVAYCPSYNYSDLLKLVKQIELSNHKKQIIHQTMFCQSLSGLVIPLLTITDFSVSDKDKKCILATARIHPGESNGSYMMQGFLKFICGESQIATQLRKLVIFKVIPMINPDGVVMGNFRTSFCGKDLNRVFKQRIDMLFPEVKFLKQLTLSLKQQFKNRLILFLDFHGHSVRKNVFIYGPEYGIFESNYYKTRILPKIISTKTEMFRFYSCSFRIDFMKKTTARAILLKNIPHCYTIQASTNSYYSKSKKKDIEFTPRLWEEMGSIVGESIYDYIQLLIEEVTAISQKKKSMKQKKQLKQRKKNIKLRQSYDRQNTIGNKESKREFPVIKKKLKPRNLSIDELNTSINKTKDLKKKKQYSLNTQKIIEQIKRDEKQQKQQRYERQSDHFSQGGSDSQSKDDLDQKQLNKLHENIIDSLEQFKLKFGQKKHLKQKKIKKHKIQQQSFQLNIPTKQKKIHLSPITNSHHKISDSATQIKSIKNNSKAQIFSWSKIQNQFILRASKVKSSSRYFTKSQLNSALLQMNNIVIYDMSSKSNS